MNVFLLSVFCVACVLAAPYESPASKQSGSYYTTVVRQPIVSILKQIHQVNDDGSYTFGYEAADGTFRVEKKDTVGYVVGKYGYKDDHGKFQVLDYVAGKEAGRTLGFQPRGDLIPAVLRINRAGSSSSPEQKALDYEYSSVDDDEDGIPDRAPGYKAVQPVRVEYQQKVVQQPVVRVETPAYSQKVAQPPVRVEIPTYQTVVQPPVRVETTDYQQKVVQPPVRVETPIYQTVVQPPVRVETPTYQQVVEPVVRVETTDYQQKVVQPPVRVETIEYQTVAQPAVVQQKIENSYVHSGQSIFREPSTTVKVQKTAYGNQDQLVQVQQPATTTTLVSAAQQEDQPDSISINSPEFFGLRII